MLFLRREEFTVSISTLDPAGCEERQGCAETPEDHIPLSSLPKLVWLGGVLFTANLLVGFGMWATPTLMTDPFGQEVHASDSASSKPSPFTSVVDTTRHKARLAAKATPVAFVPTPESTDIYAAAALDMPRGTTQSLDRSQLDLPVRTERAAYRSSVSPSDSKRLSDTSGTMYMPVRTERAVYDSTADAAPRRSSESQKKFVVIN